MSGTYTCLLNSWLICLVEYRSFFYSLSIKIHRPARTPSHNPYHATRNMRYWSPHNLRAYTYLGENLQQDGMGRSSINDVRLSDTIG